MCSFNDAQGYIILPIPATPLNPQSFYTSSIYWVIFQGIVSNHFILMLGTCSFHLFLYVSACIATNCMLSSCLIVWCCILSPITHWSEKYFTDLVNLWWLHLFIIYFHRRPTFWTTAVRELSSPNNFSCVSFNVLCNSSEII